MPFPLPVEPMLAKLVPDLPRAERGVYAYEPKWDGFRCVILRDGEEVELASRGLKPLTRYFPELVDAVRRLLPERIALDAEVVVRSGTPGAERLDWDALSQRIHPADSRIRRLSGETPAELVCFDLLALGDEDLQPLSYTERRRRLEEVFGAVAPGPIHLTKATDDPDTAVRWFETFEGAGLDGVIVKPTAAPYVQGKRTMFKVKHSRTADCVVFGYRVHTSGQGVGSLLLGAYHDGQLIPVGGIGAFSNAVRTQLIEDLAPLVIRDEDGGARTGEGMRSRFSGAKDASFVRLEPELVVEVRFDQLEGHRFRHAAQFVRWRPDRDPQSCLLEQIDRAPAYDLAAVLT